MPLPEEQISLSGLCTIHGCLCPPSSSGPAGELWHLLVITIHPEACNWNLWIWFLNLNLNLKTWVLVWLQSYTWTWYLDDLSLDLEFGLEIESVCIWDTKWEYVKSSSCLQSVNCQLRSFRCFWYMAATYGESPKIIGKNTNFTESSVPSRCNSELCCPQDASTCTRIPYTHRSVCRGLWWSYSQDPDMPQQSGRIAQMRFRICGSGQSFCRTLSTKISLPNYCLFCKNSTRQNYDDV